MSADKNCLLPQINRNKATRPGDGAFFSTILSEKTSMPLDSRLTRRNNHVFAFGASQEAIRGNFIIPNILQGNASYIIHDATGELLRATGPALEKLGYEIRVLNLSDPTKSNHYNPFHYLHNEEDVLKLVYTIFRGTAADPARPEDLFFLKAEQALMKAIFFYLRHECRWEDNALFWARRLLSCGSVENDNASTMAILDILFGDLKKKDPENIAVQNYDTFSLFNPKLAADIIGSCLRRIDIFGKLPMKELTMTDETDLNSIGERPVALFCIPNPEDKDPNFLISALYHQALAELTRLAVTKRVSEEEPHHVRFFLDGLENIPKIEDLALKLNTSGKYNIYFTLTVHSMQAFQDVYLEDSQCICGVCDTQIFFGMRKEEASLEDLRYVYGVFTCEAPPDPQLPEPNKSKGRDLRVRDLRQIRNAWILRRLSNCCSGEKNMTAEMLFRMEKDDCLIHIHGADLVWDKQYPLSKHPNLHLLNKTPD